MATQANEPVVQRRWPIVQSVAQDVGVGFDLMSGRVEQRRLAVLGGRPLLRIKFSKVDECPHGEDNGDTGEDAVTPGAA